jgi:capsid protein
MNIFNLNWEWVATGVPWLNPLQEVQADIAAINASLTSRQRLCKERGEDWFEIVKEQAAEQQYLVELGLNPTATPLPMTITVSADNEEEGNND